MATDIRLKKSSVAGRIPSTSNLEFGEIALNYQDGKLYYKDASNNIRAFLDSSNISTLVSNTIDSDFVADRSAITFPVLNEDSSLSHNQKVTFIAVAKNGVVELQPQTTFVDSAGTESSVNINFTSGGLDSAQAITLIDSDYIKTVQYGDNERLKFGSGNNLQFFHNSSGPHNRIETTNNNLFMNVGGGYAFVVSGETQFETKDLVIAGSRTGTAGAVSRLKFRNRAGSTSINTSTAETNIEGWRINSATPSLVFNFNGTEYHRFDDNGKVALGAVPTSFGAITETVEITGTLKTTGRAKLNGGATITGDVIADSATIGPLKTTDSGVLVTGGLSANYLAPVAGATYTPPPGSGSDTSTTTSMAIHRGTSIDVGHNGFVRRLLTAASSGAIQIGHSSTTGLYGNVQIFPGSGGSVFLYHKGTNQKFRTTDTGVSVTGSLISDSATIAGLNYPTADGANGQAIITDGNGTLTFGTVASGGGGGGTTGTVNQIKVNSYTGDSSTKAFTLSAAPASGSENSVVVTINGVTQHVNSYSLSGAVITLDSAPITGDEIEMRVHDDVTANINLRDYKSFVYTPSTNTSAFTGADANGNTLAYDLGKVEVYLNGARLVTGLDYTETSGSVLTLDSAIGSGDTLEIVSLAKAAISDGNFVRNVDSDFTTTTANQIIDTFAKTSFRTTKYIAQIEHDSDNKYHSEEILLTHNGSAVAMTTYAQLLLDSNLGTFDADIIGTDVRLKFTPTYTNTSVKLKVIRTDA